MCGCCEAPREGRARLIQLEDSDSKRPPQIVPSPPAAEESGIEPADVEAPQARAHRRTWAVLLSRIFDVDGTLCPSCGGRMRLIAALTDEVSIRHYLKGVGLPSVPPPIAPARPPPQTEFEFGA